MKTVTYRLIVRYKSHIQKEKKKKKKSARQKENNSSLNVEISTKRFPQKSEFLSFNIHFL